MLGQKPISGGPISDNLRTVKYYLIDVTERVTPKDSQAESMTSPISIAELASAIEMFAENSTSSCSIAESGQLIDSLLPQLLAPASVSEKAEIIAEEYYCKPVFNASKKVWHVGSC